MRPGRWLALVVALLGAASACAREAPGWGGRAGRPLAQREPTPEEGRRPQAPGPAEAGPENATPVERYGDESTLGFVRATIVRSAIAHTAAQRGRAITLLVGGTDVAQVAARGGAVLVKFADPADPSRSEVGWIPSAAIRPPQPRVCPARHVAVVTTLGSFCTIPCRGASGCGANEACVPAGTPARKGSRITDALSYCVER